MRSIGIVGAGQAGIVLAAALLRSGWRVVIHTDRSPSDHLADRGRPTACLFGDQVEYERSVGLPEWPQAPRMRRIHLDLCTPDGVAFSIDAPLRKPALAVDQRLKFSAGLEVLAAQGAEVVIGAVTDLDALAAEHDLVVVTVGREAFGGLFPRDASRSVHTAPQRKVFMVNLEDCDQAASPAHAEGVFSFVPGVLEIFWIPFHDKDAGPARSVVVEVAPGGPADRFDGVTSADEGLAVLRSIVADFVPHEVGYLATAVPTSPVTWLAGALTPVVRRPVAVLPSGRHVLGLGDAVVLNDPLAGQGANNATRMAAFFAAELAAHTGPLTPEWLSGRFDEFWRIGQYTNLFSNGLLAPMADFQQEVLAAASQDPVIGERLWEGFNNPASLFPWFFDGPSARTYLAQRERSRRPATGPALL
ncbi:styrene monooxygenase/indole monooxygenase family protein [Actinosynnema sp. NPDC020468]|uniref:styrene monooxygenase/indole monooxygenase family protein n=1 Tax=Actinosynnema sp. NPDC020468 TaxID=3154488 RepID=UPI0033D07CCA